jgi:hypothetical protein
MLRRPLALSFLTSIPSLAACLAAFLAPFLAGCSADSAVDPPSKDAGTTHEASCQAYVPDASLTTPTVTFGHDVLPIFESSCAIAGGTCHGDTTVASLGRPYLGEHDGGTDAAFLLKGLVGVPAAEDPQMNIVNAGNPGQSYLMHKMDGDQCTLMQGCQTSHTQYTNCGDLMPQGGITTLPADTRDTVRRWIAQGAKSQ